jgi:glycosyltransferase involved in cell wall biosynthesis
VTVIAASVPFDGPRLSEQHLASTLAAAGHPVLYLDPPRPFWSRGDGLATIRPVSWSVSEVSAGLTRATLGVPPGSRGALGPSVDRLRSGLARRLIRQRGQEPAAVISAASRPTVFTGYGAARTVFWAKDDYVAGAGLLGMDAGRIAAGQAAVAEVVDIAVAVTPGLQKTWATRIPRVSFIPAGADLVMAASVLTAAPAGDVTLRGPIVGFVGQISDRIDLGLLEAVADAGLPLLLVGRRQPTFSDATRFAALCDRSTVQWVGARDYTELPSYLALIDVGLVPYTDSPFNRASFPLKLLEYLSVGAAVVSSDLPAARWLDSPDVKIATADGFAAAATELVGAASAPASELAVTRAGRRSRAAEHSWERRARQWAEVLGLNEPA